MIAKELSDITVCPRELVVATIPAVCEEEEEEPCNVVDRSVVDVLLIGAVNMPVVLLLN